MYLLLSLKWGNINFFWLNFKKYIDDLEALKLAVVKSKEGIQKMRDVNENTKGISRSLNQSIRFLNKDLDTYLEFTDQINAGIDRIILTSGYSI